MKCLPALALGLVATLGGTGSAMAQELETDTGPRLSVGGSLGLANGATRAAVADLSVAYHPVPVVAVRLLATGWRNTGACDLVLLPGVPNTCDLRGVSGRIGVELAPVRWGRVAPFASANGGIHARSGRSDGWISNPVVGLGLGGRADLGAWSLRLEARHSRVFDSEYADSAGDELGLTALVVGVEYWLDG